MEALIVILVVLAIILGIILLIWYALHKTTKKYLGKGLSETAKLLSDGLKSETTLPKPISNLTALYKPKIERDFPEIRYSGMETMVRNGIVAILNAIESENPTVSKGSPNLTMQLRGIIEDNQSKGIKAYYDNITIHKISVADYKSDKTKASARFEISLQCNEYTVSGEKVKSGSKTDFSQSAYSVLLAYNQNAYLDSNEITFGSNCPNCGAPVSAIGEEKFCEFCGTGFSVIEDRVWEIDSFKLLK